MGIFDFLKSKPEVKKESLKFEDISNWIDKKEKELENKEKETIEQISKMVFDINQKLNEKKSVLENTNLQSKKTDDRIRFVVKENIEKYIYHLEKLIANLTDLNEKRKELSIEEFINKVNLSFINFNQRSELNFEKATFLIGKELGEVKDSISLFFKDFNRLIDENKEAIVFLEKIEKITLELNEIQNIKKNKKESDENIKEYEEKVNNFEIEIKAIEKNVINIKKSKDYLLELKGKKENENEKIKILNEITNLRERIDFKKLAGIFHSDSKKMRIINKYKENFNDNFQYDNGNEIMSLLKEAGIETNSIFKKIEELMLRKDKLSKITSVLDLTHVQESKLILMENQIKTAKNNIDDIKTDIEREKKKISKFIENIAEIKESVKKEISEMKVEII
jgi:hypothetical protein